MREPETQFKVVPISAIFMVVLVQNGRWNVPVASHASKDVADRHAAWLNASLEFPDVSLFKLSDMKAVSSGEEEEEEAPVSDQGGHDMTREW